MQTVVRQGIYASLAVKNKLGKIIQTQPLTVELTKEEEELVKGEAIALRATHKPPQRRVPDLSAQFEAFQATVLDQVRGIVRGVQAPAPATQPAPVVVQAPLPLPVAPEPAQAPRDPWAKENALVGSIWYARADRNRPEQKDRTILLESFEPAAGRYTIQAHGGSSRSISYDTLHKPGQGFWLLRLAGERHFRFPPQH